MSAGYRLEDAGVHSGPVAESWDCEVAWSGISFRKIII
jgi:hypothetical protein